MIFQSVLGPISHEFDRAHPSIALARAARLDPRLQSNAVSMLRLMASALGHTYDESAADDIFFDAFFNYTSAPDEAKVSALLPEIDRLFHELAASNWWPSEDVSEHFRARADAPTKAYQDYSADDLARLRREDGGEARYAALRSAWLAAGRPRPGERVPPASSAEPSRRARAHAHSTSTLLVSSERPSESTTDNGIDFRGCRTEADAIAVARAARERREAAIVKWNQRVSNESRRSGGATL